MLDSPILEIAIGLSFVYLMLSLFATVIVDWTIEFRGWRGRMLYARLHALLGSTLIDHFYRDPRVASLASGTAASPGEQAAPAQPAPPPNATPPALPSASPPKTSRLRTPIPYLSAIRALTPWQARRVAAVLGARRLPSYIPDSVVADVLMGWLQGNGLPAALHPESAPRDANPVPTRLAELWQRLALKVDGDQDALRHELTAWFRQCTERMTGEFRRLSRIALLVVGAVVVLATDADSLRIGMQLYREPQLRTQIVAAAERADRECTDGARDCAHLEAQLEAAVKDGAEQASMGLLGWDDARIDRLLQAGASERAWTLLGWFMTMMAIGLGAEFWFGTLKKLISIRNARRAAATDAEGDAGGPPSSTEAVAPRSSEPRAPLDIADPRIKGLKGFQPMRFAESNVHAFWLAQFASLAYSAHDTLSKSPLLELHGLKLTERLDADGTQGYVLKGDTCCIVAFRGTEASVDDIVTDTNCRTQPVTWWPNVTSGPSLAAHSGFDRAVDGIWETLEAGLKDVTVPIWLTGHSLGGALALLAAIRLHQRPRGVPAVTIGGVYTFGQPRVASPALVAACPLLLTQRVFRYVNASDVVPLVPPRRTPLPGLDGGPPEVFEYDHIGHVRYFDASGRLHHQRTLWEQVAEQLLPDIADVLTGGTSWRNAALQHARKRIADHGMARYIECLERISAVRELWAEA